MISMLIVFICSCNRQPVATIDGKQPPAFEFRHYGKLSSVTVYEIIPRDKDSYNKGKLHYPLVSDTLTLWKLEPDPNVGTGDGVQMIYYGQVPPGFIQKYPNEGPPPALEEGKFYGVTGITDEPNELSIAFAVSNGRTITQ